MSVHAEVALAAEAKDALAGLQAGCSDVGTESLVVVLMRVHALELA